MAEVKGTMARIGKDGVVDHKHGDFGWHWACAGHRDNGEIHVKAQANQPTWEEGQDTPAHREAYRKAFTREVITRIPSKAKAKA